MEETKKGLTIIYTGNGKGKTTAAIGLAVRAYGQDLRVGIFQFIKSPERDYGEKKTLEKLGIEIIQLGIGFTWTKTPEEHRQALKRGWEFVKEKVMSGSYDLIVLDELNNALAITDFPIDDVLPLKEVIQLLQQRPKALHVVITGRNAKPELINQADLVSEIQEVKHYYNERIPAVKGIEY